MEYFAISPLKFHMEKEYNKNIPWYGMEFFEDFVLLKWAGSLVHLLTPLEILYGHMVVATMGVLPLFII
jgi:hypothetical protein